MTLRGLAALGVLVVAGCKQSIINVYPAACATPAGVISGYTDWVIPAHMDTPTPVANPTPKIDWNSPAGAALYWRNYNNYMLECPKPGGFCPTATATPTPTPEPGNTEHCFMNGMEVPCGQPTPTPAVVAGCPSMVLVLTYETQQTIKLPFDYAMTEADGESNCWYWLNGDQANGMHGQGVSILRGKQ